MATLLAGCTPPSTSGPGVDRAAPGTAVPRGPAPPDRTRWAGVDRLVVAVPRGWETVGGICAAPGPRQVALQVPGAATVRCALPRRGSPSLSFSPPGSVGWSPGRGMRCERPSWCSAVVGADGVRLRLAWRGPHAERDLRALLDSARVVPDGWTTVPPIDYGVSDARGLAVLEEAGLVGVPPDVDWPHYVIGTQPRAGSVVAEGSEVALVPGDG